MDSRTLSITTAIAVYFLIWWLVLFAVLPWNIRSQVESGSVAPGTDPGAPAIAGLRRKLIWTTIVSACVFAILSIVYSYRLIALDDLAASFGVPQL
jgi:predicted secreted protein